MERHTNEEQLLKTLADALHRCKRTINGNNCQTELRRSIDHIHTEDANTLME